MEAGFRGSRTSGHGLVGTSVRVERLGLDVSRRDVVGRAGAAERGKRSVLWWFPVEGVRVTVGGCASGQRTGAEEWEGVTDPGQKLSGMVDVANPGTEGWTGGAHGIEWGVWV